MHEVMNSGKRVVRGRLQYIMYETRLKSSIQRVHENENKTDTKTEKETVSNANLVGAGDQRLCLLYMYILHQTLSAQRHTGHVWLVRDQRLRHLSWNLPRYIWAISISSAPHERKGSEGHSRVLAVLPQRAKFGRLKLRQTDPAFIHGRAEKGELHSYTAVFRDAPPLDLDVPEQCRRGRRRRP